MPYDRHEIEQLLDMEGGFQRITLMETGKLTIDVERDNKKKRSMVIHFPTPEEAGRWVDGFFKEFATTEGSPALQ
jgi:hypothetical protein